MQVTLAMLDVLAKCRDGRATLEVLVREVTSAEGQVRARRFLEFDNIDALPAGLVIEENDGLRITETGRAVLRAIEDLGESSSGKNSLARLPSLKKIDDLIGTEMRQKIFNLDLQPRSGGADFEPADDQATIDLDDAGQPDRIVEQPADEPTNSDALETFPATHTPPAWTHAPPVSTVDFGKLKATSDTAPSARYIPLASSMKRFGSILRGHIEQEPPHVGNVSGGGTSGLVLSILALLGIILCAGAYIAVTQIKSLKSEISTLERQLESLKKQAANSEPRQKASADQKIPPPVVAADNDKLPAERRPTAPSLTLSPDEIRLIREYIKPSPVKGPAAKPISVGDPVVVGTIPLPSPVTDKVPKLLGARFTIQNGAIIILKRDSRQADAVLQSN